MLHAGPYEDEDGKPKAKVLLTSPALVFVNAVRMHANCFLLHEHLCFQAKDMVWSILYIFDISSNSYLISMLVVLELLQPGGHCNAGTESVAFMQL